MTKKLDENRFYVYLHRRGDNNEVFYVGKGCGRRATSLDGHNSWWDRIYKKHGRTVEFVETQMSEQSALDLEVELIKYYRENGHTLCNLTDGGEGISGHSIPRKTDILTFYNKDTDTVFECIQNELCTIYGLSAGDASAVARGRSRRKGVALLDYVDKDRPKKHDFVVIATGEVKRLTVREASEFFKLPLKRMRGLSQGQPFTYEGLTVLDDKPRTYKEPRKYSLREISTGIVVEATSREIWERFGIFPSNLNKLVKGKSLKSMGYCLASTTDEMLAGSSNDIYSLINHETGHSITGTRAEIMATIGLSSSQFYSVTRGWNKTALGYSLVNQGQSI